MGLWKNILDYSHGSLTEIVAAERRYRTIPSEKRSVIVGAAFGTTSCNERLADAVYGARLHFDPELPAILQKEIFDRYVQQYGMRKTASVGTTNSKDISTVVSEIDTKGVLTLARNVIDANYLDRESLVYVAHPAHMQRVIDVGRKLGLSGVPFVEQEVQWSSSDDRQRWTVSPARWLFREMLARVHHKWNGYT